MPEQAVFRRAAGVEEEVSWPALTLEAVLYGVLLLGAAALRFYDLGRWPLLGSEAVQALAAWRFLHGQAVGAGVVPFLFDGALLSFFALGASDAAARLVPALLGMALVLVPLALRRRLGTWGALAATFALGFSPLLVFSSRTLAGAMPMLAGVGALLVAWEWTGTGRVGPARALTIAGIAVAANASPWFYTFLLAVGFWWGGRWLMMRRSALVNGRHGTRSRHHDGHAAPHGSALTNHPREILHSLLGGVRTWLVLAVATAVVAMGLAMRRVGLQGLLDQFGFWLGSLVPGSRGHAWGYPLLLLAFYELPLLVLGAVGGVLALRRRDGWAGFMALWASLGILLAVASGTRDGEPVALVLLPLALLSGSAVESLVTHLRPGRWARVGIGLAVFSSFLGFWWLQIAALVNPEVSMAHPVYAILAILQAAMPLLLVAVCAALWYSLGGAETRTVLTLVGLGLGACMLLRGAVSLNLAHGNDAREPLLQAPTALDVRDLTAFLEDWSVRQTLDQHALSIVMQEDLSPLLAWHLRDFSALRTARHPEDETEAGAILVRSTAAVTPPAGMMRTRYRLQTSAPVPLSSVQEALAWWLLGIGPDTQEAETIDLWVKSVKE